MSKTVVLRRVLLLLAIIMSGGSLLFPRLPILAGIVLLYLFLRGGRLTLKRSLVPVCLLLIAILLLTLLRGSGFDALSLAIRFANFLAGLMLLDLYLRQHPNTLLDDLFAILRLMALQAILTVVLAETVNGLFLPLPVEGTNYQTMFLLFTYHSMIDGSTALTRPDGFFYEPGVFQIYLNILLFISLYARRDWLWSGIALLAVLLTQSTTGVVIATGMVGWFVATRFINRGSLGMRVLKFGAGIVLLVPVVLFTAGNVVTKFTGEAQGSFWARQYDLITGLNVIAESPVLGIGFDYEQYRRASSRLGYAETQLSDEIIQDRGNTNGVVFLLYSIGVPLAIPFLIGIFRQRFFAPRWLMGIALFLTFLSESMIFTPFFLMLIFSGLLPARASRGSAPAPVDSRLGTT